MMVLGKQCPTCGSKKLVARKESTTALPVVPTYICTECRQLLRFFFPFSISAEHRRFPRKQLPPFILVRVPEAEQPQYARINNISEGGLCFEKHGTATHPESPVLTLDLYNCNDGTALEQLSAEIVAVREQLLETKGVKTTIVRHCARFVNLNRAQQKVLHFCLAQYGF